MSGKGDTLVLFDVDGTITPSRQVIEDPVHEYLRELRSRVTVGLVGGSDLNKIAEQTLPSALKGVTDPISNCLESYDYVFAENGLVAYKDGSMIAKKSIVDHIGDEKLQRFINFCLHYMSKLELPVKRGNFIEFRNGLINVCPVGRSCNQSERDNFNDYDKKHGVRAKFIEELKKRFGPDSDDPLDMVYSIGGQISFDAFPKGWDKTYCLNLIDSGYKRIYFFGDKTAPGGNDHEIYSDARTIGHSVKNPSDTLDQLRDLKL